MIGLTEVIELESIYLLTTSEEIIFFTGENIVHEASTDPSRLGNIRHRSSMKPPTRKEVPGGIYNVLAAHIPNGSGAHRGDQTSLDVVTTTFDPEGSGI